MKSQLLYILLLLTLLAACSKNNEKIISLSQLKDKRIYVLTGSAGDHAARMAFPDAKILDMVGSADAALAVKTGKADAFIYDKSILTKIVSKNPELVILDEPVSKLEVAAAIGKENTQLIAGINSALDELENKGVLDSLKKKWIETDYKDAPPMPVISIAGNNGTLKMGTCAIYEPYTFQSNGKIIGFDIELSMLLGKLLDKKIELVDMTFESLIPALISGKIDFALSNFTVTDERKKSISYSRPYITNDISVLVRNN
jgi:polar amino acid transport system substrate-binding protein